jgi:hypothetical protein
MFLFILYIDIFDEFGVVARTDESFDDDTTTPENKFWCYRLESPEYNPPELTNQSFLFFFIVYYIFKKKIKFDKNKIKKKKKIKIKPTYLNQQIYLLVP